MARQTHVVEKQGSLPQKSPAQTAASSKAVSAPPIVTQLAAARRGHSFGNLAVTNAPAERIQCYPLTAAQWKHISQGEITPDNRLVGYHWTGDDKAVAMPIGEKEGPDSLGIYKSKVRSKAKIKIKGKEDYIEKTNPSTFWPDEWSEKEIKEVIGNASGKAQNNIVTVNKKPPGREDAYGMALFVNPDSVFPVYQEPQASRKGGKKR
jgi:hypothetical protein